MSRNRAIAVWTLVVVATLLLLVSSLAAIVHIPGLASYNVSKAGVEALGDTLRPELRHLGVRVGVAHMTFVDTDMVRGADEHPVFGRLKMQNVFPKLGATPGAVRWAGPSLGEHTDEVLAERAGCPPERLQALRAQGVI